MRRYTTYMGAASQKRAPNRTEKIKRSMVVGLVLAIQHAARIDGTKFSRRKATEMVLECCPFVAASRDTIEGWITRGTAAEAQVSKEEWLAQANEVKHLFEGKSLLQLVRLFSRFGSSPPVA
jgi:hypothetical protein